MFAVTRTMLLPCCGLAMGMLPSAVLSQSSKVPPTGKTQIIVPPALSLETSSGDIRLSKSFRLTCDAEPLGDILARISKEAGIQFTIEGKWVEDLPTYAYTHPLPLHILMQRLASLHTLTWRRAEIPAPASPNATLPLLGYVLYQSALNKAYIVRLKQQSWDVLRQHVTDFRRIAALPATTLKEMADKGDSLARDMQNPRARAGIIMVAAVPDAMLEELIQKHTRTFTFSQLSPSCQEALTLLVQQHEAQAAELRALPLQPGEIRFPLPVVTPEMYRVRYFVDGEGDGANLRTMLLPPQGFFTGAEPGYSGGAAGNWSDARYAAGRAGVLPQNRLEARKTPEAVTFDGASLRNALRILCDKWNLNVFCDAYPAEPLIDTGSKSFPQYYALHTPMSDAVGEFGMWQRAWWQEGAAGTDLLLLKDDWYQRRDEGHSNVVIARLKETRAQGKPLSLEDWGELFALPDITASRITSSVKVSLFAMQGIRDIVGFYNNLRPRERQRLLAQGLSYAELAGDYQERLAQAVQAGSAELNADRLGTVRLRLRVEKDASVFSLQDEPQDGANIKAAVLREWRVPGVPRDVAALPAPRPLN